MFGKWVIQYNCVVLKHRILIIFIYTENTYIVLAVYMNKYYYINNCYLFVYVNGQKLNAIKCVLVAVHPFLGERNRIYK